ncbi:MAG TPA: DciA family protein [Stellaceae bacterium]|jgi:hypothetical protein
MSAANRQRSVAGLTAGGERRAGFRALGVAAAKLARPVVAKRGGGVLVRLKADWPAIVGADWAAQAWPTALSRDGVLKLRTASAAALELQHRAPLLIERINLYFGRSIVARLALVQGPLPYPGPPSARSVQPPDAGDEAALDQSLAEFADPELRAALGRLGRAVIAARK